MHQRKLNCSAMKHINYYVIIIKCIVEILKRLQKNAEDSQINMTYDMQQHVEYKKK